MKLLDQQPSWNHMLFHPLALSQGILPEKRKEDKNSKVKEDNRSFKSYLEAAQKRGSSL
ncbi:hypothetical protein [Pseudobacillus badius]|uniref:hypothetical protein n=1 Tax=Bacillus badius TaxID=1455 RepID=UPI003D3477EE